MEILKQENRHILVVQLLVEYSHVADLLDGTKLGSYDPIYTMKALQSTFTEYYGSMIHQQADGVTCAILLNSYVALLDATDPTGRTGEMCRKFADAYRIRLRSLDASKWLVKANLMSFFDCRNYSIFSLLHEDLSDVEILCDTDKDSGLVKGHVFVHYLGDEVELIGIQTDLYHTISGAKLGFSTKAFDHVLKGLKPEVKYVYAVAWRTVSDILVKKYGFETIQVGSRGKLDDIYVHTNKDGRVLYSASEHSDFHPPSPEVNEVISRFGAFIYQEYMEPCEPSCYIFTYKKIKSGYRE